MTASEASPSHRVIVGTAGHVDHGKTKLLEALTGIDCDRWAEEKARGITIDLGFAHLRDGNLQVGFIDVPGHERFLRNALAGLGGIRVMLLVIAADEGVEPQTREHLAICALLDIPYAVVALTKVDLVASDLVELAQLEIEEVLEGTPFAGSPVLPVSALTGAGMPELRSILLATAREAALDGEDKRSVRLPIDRAFLLKGLGTVVTGTLLSGEIEVGDELELVPNGGCGKVRSVQVHGESRKRGRSGERVSLQLTGWELEALTRGGQLASPGSLSASHSLLADVTLLPETDLELSGWTPVRVHLLSAEALGKVRPLDPAVLGPGESGIVELRLDHAVAARRDDHIVLRRPSPALTLGGGKVLDPLWHRRRGTWRDEAVQAIATDIDSAITTWVTEAGEAGTDAESLTRRLATTPKAVDRALQQLTNSGKLLRVKARGARGPLWLAPSVVQRVEQRARKVLTEYFDQQRLADSMPKAEAVRRILRPQGQELADTFLDWLAARKVLVVAGDRVGLYGRTTLLTDDESKLSKGILQAFERGGLDPPAPSELSRTLGAKPQIFDGMMQYLIEQKKLTRLPGGLILATAAIDDTRHRLADLAWERFDVPRFKDQFGLSRKWAIPILEHLDSIGVTRRLGNERQLVS
ncbi:MAG: selenocysteine-specific translation elongation factor [Thermoanaerobaculia bacterium]|nr:selenocysteine-specific translation elongation factor [Thermoanaerobaculia bacterium]